MDIISCYYNRIALCLPSLKSNIKRLLFLGSSCIYPKFASQPIKEESLLTGSLELTNEAYALAKITGIKLCEALRKQHNFDAFTIDLNYINGKFNSVIKR